MTNLMCINIDKNTEIKVNDKILRKAIYNAFDGKCFYTGRNITFEKMHIDHILPISAGGKNCISNYVLSSSYINLKKRDTYSDKFIELTTELNNLLFVDNVIKEYINIYFNYNTYKDYKELTLFFKEKNINDKFKKGKIRNMFASNLKVVKIKRDNETRNRLFYKENEMEQLYLEKCL